MMGSSGGCAGKQAWTRRLGRLGAAIALLPGISWASADRAIGPHVVDRTLELKAGRIDTSTLENLLPLDVIPFEPGERLVLQLDGPLTPQRRADLLSAGVELGEYLPQHAYLVRADAISTAALRNLPFVAWLGRFDSAWRIDPELGVRPYQSDARLALRSQGLTQIVVVLFAGDAPDAALGELSASGATILGQHLVGPQWMIDAISTLDTAYWMAEQPFVQYVEEAPEGAPRNDSNRWILQSNVNAQTPIWNRGIHGEGQVAGLIDGTPRESHCMFDDTPAPGPTHRKFVGWRNTGTIDSHGTHTAGTIAGDATPFNAYTTNDGIAYAAKISFSGMSAIFSNPSTLYARLIDQHNDGARAHSNSWGDDGTTAYTTWCRQIDQYSYDREEGVVAFAVTNLSTLRSPENSTSVLAVGASQDTPSQANHCSGGAGPTIDGRRKPEIYAPGCGTVSASSSSACGTASLTGTSMACPAITGAALLVRQYFTDGFYPTGVATPADALVPSGALLRAALINGSVDMTGIAGYPSNTEGWGRLLLDNVLYFPGDTAKLFVVDVRNSDGLSTGQAASYTFQVASNAVPLRVTMAYTQPPAAVNASNPVINNIDLEVLDPGANLYRGNVFASGQSATGGTADAKNSIENVIRMSPAVGTYTVTIRGTAVNAGQGVGLQGYALVVSGDITVGCSPPVVGDMNDDCHVDLDDLTALLSTFGLCAGNPGFNANADFDGSGCIDLGDLTVLLANFGV